MTDDTRDTAPVPLRLTFSPEEIAEHKASDIRYMDALWLKLLANLERDIEAEKSNEIE